MATPVRDHSGAVVAGLSVAGPSQRLPAAKLPSLIAQTVEAAAEVSRRMGYRNGKGRRLIEHWDGSTWRSDGSSRSSRSG